MLTNKRHQLQLRLPRLCPSPALHPSQRPARVSRLAARANSADDDEPYHPCRRAPLPQLRRERLGIRHDPQRPHRPRDLLGLRWLGGGAGRCGHVDTQTMRFWGRSPWPLPFTKLHQIVPNRSPQPQRKAWTRARLSRGSSAGSAAMQRRAALVRGGLTAVQSALQWVVSHGSLGASGQ